MGAGRHPRSIAGDDSAADHGAGSIEEPTAAEARPFLELLLEPLVVDGETMAPHRWSARTLVSPSLPLRPMAMDEQERWDRAGVRP
jgi:hypothetical protein